MVGGPELIEATVVQHQQHLVCVALLGNAEETLRGVVGLHIAHLLRGEHLVELCTVGLEAGTAVDEELHIGPHLQHILLARIFKDTLQHNQIPRRHAREGPHVIRHSLLADFGHLVVETWQQSNLFAGDTEVHSDAWGVVHHCATHVADANLTLHSPAITSSKREGLTHKSLALGVEVGVDGCHIFGALHMVVFDTLLGDGYVLAVSCGSARTLGHIPQFAGPYNFLLSGPHPVDKPLKVGVLHHGHPLAELRVGESLHNTEFLAEGGFATSLDEFCVLFVLYLYGVLFEMLNLLDSRCEVDLHQFGYQ